MDRIVKCNRVRGFDPRVLGSNIDFGKKLDGKFIGPALKQLVQEKMKPQKEEY
jgi:hypothetical protein